VATVAEKTGWPMEHILWRLPLAAGLQLMDVWNSRAGAPLVWQVDIDKVLENATSENPI
jgi:predicted nicotinamide N-methyase